MIIGYIFTLAYLALFVGLLAALYLLRDSIAKKLSKDISLPYLVVVLLVIAFFVSFSLLYVSPVEQLYFDENIYQGIALNILHSGNALWCQFGTAMLTSCPNSVIYHDPVEISFYIAIAFVLFGAGMQTAYGTSLFIGALSILLVFLLGSSLFGKRAGLASAIIFALIPEVFIWSRTQAIPDLIFMMFSILTFYAYEIYRSGKSTPALCMFLSALGITIYLRIEAILLIPIFMVLLAYETGVTNGIRKGISRLLEKERMRNIIILAVFIMLITPEIYYILYENQGGNYGNGYLCGSQSNSTFSLNDFKCNMTPNVMFFLGADNELQYYPAYFSAITTIIAVVGAAVMLFSRVRKGIPLLLLGLWIVVFHFFYDAFYAGSVLYGVDVRFMLIIYPAIAILGGFGIASISDGIPRALRSFRERKNEAKRRISSSVIFTVLVILFAVLPFYYAMPITAVSPPDMPQEAVPMAATNFIYQNVALVPSRCLVFSFTPEIWWEQNRSAAEVGYFNEDQSNFTSFESNFSCFVFDEGYWCTVPPYINGVSGLCQENVSGYTTTPITEQRVPDQNDNFSLYYINGYKP